HGPSRRRPRQARAGADARGGAPRQRAAPARGSGPGAPPGRERAAHLVADLVGARPGSGDRAAGRRQLAPRLGSPRSAAPAHARRPAARGRRHAALRAPRRPVDDACAGLLLQRWRAMTAALRGRLAGVAIAAAAVLATGAVSVPAAPGAPAADAAIGRARLPAPQLRTFGNGLQVAVFPIRRLPIVQVQLLVPA